MVEGFETAESTEKYWYRSFKLRENPYRYIDAQAEVKVKGFPEPLMTSMLGKIGANIFGKVSCVVRGERGAGKSAIARELRRRGQIVCEKTVDLEGLDYQNKAVIVDFPDNLSGRGLDSFIWRCGRMLKDLATLVLLVNDEQAELIRKTDTFARLPVLRFEKQDKTFYKALYHDRLKAFGEEGASEPFKPEVVDKLAEVARTPRDFIQMCSLVLSEMWMKGMKEQADLAFIDQLSVVHDVQVVLHVPENISQALPPIIDELKAQGKQWVRVMEIAGLLEKRGLKVDYTRLGRMLKNNGFEGRRTKEGRWYRIA